MDTIQKNLAESGNSNSSEKAPQLNVVLSLSISGRLVPHLHFLVLMPQITQVYLVIESTNMKSGVS